jgi:hypothetical protein
MKIELDPTAVDRVRVSVRPDGMVEVDVVADHVGPRVDTEPTFYLDDSGNLTRSAPRRDA